jgi:hypothetical protein
MNPWAAIDRLERDRARLARKLRESGWALGETDGVFWVAERPARWDWEETLVRVRGKSKRQLLARIQRYDASFGLVAP